MAQLPPFEEPGNVLYGGFLGRFRHVIDQDEADGDVAGLELQRHGGLGSDAGGVEGEDAVVAQDLATDLEVPGKVHLDDVIDALPTGHVPDALHGVFRPVVDGGVGTGGQGDLRLLVGADRGDDPGAMQLGQLDSVVTDGSSAAGDQHRLAGDRSIRQDAAMGGHRRDPEAGALHEAGVGGQRDGAYGRLDRILGGGAEGAADLRLIEPDAFAEAGRGYARADADR